VCGVSGIEFLVILVVAVIVLGPERLPEAMRTLGKMARELRKITDEFSDVRDEFTREFREELERDPAQQKSNAAQSAQRRAKAGRAGQDVPEIDRIRAERAAETQAEPGETTDAPADTETLIAIAAPALASSAEDDHPLAAPPREAARPLPTLKPAAGSVASAATAATTTPNLEAGEEERTTSKAPALESADDAPVAQRTLPPKPAPPKNTVDSGSGEPS